MHIGPYKVLGRLGRGGMGSVYKVLREDLGRIMALKVLQPREILETILGVEEDPVPIHSRSPGHGGSRSPQCRCCLGSGRHGRYVVHGHGVLLHEPRHPDRRILYR